MERLTPADVWYCKMFQTANLSDLCDEYSYDDPNSTHLSVYTMHRLHRSMFLRRRPSQYLTSHFFNCLGLHYIHRLSLFRGLHFLHNHMHEPVSFSCVSISTIYYDHLESFEVSEYVQFLFYPILFVTFVDPSYHQEPVQPSF